MSRPMSRPISVALIGSRGIPARYGGYETLMEELAVRLTARGFAVTVYCRSHVTPPSLTEYRGARLVVLPTIRTKYLDTPVHTFLSCLHAAREPFDAILVVNSANASSCAPADGRRAGRLERRRHREAAGEVGRVRPFRLRAVRAPSPASCPTSWSPTPRSSAATTWSGMEPTRCPSPTASTHGRRGETGILAKLGLTSRRFFLYVSRFEPENRPAPGGRGLSPGRRRPAARHGRQRSVRQPFHRLVHPRRDPRISSRVPSTAKATASSSPMPWPPSMPPKWGYHPALVEAMGTEIAFS